MDNEVPTIPVVLSKESVCRLCLNICQDLKTLYDENRQCNRELYNILVKYFPAMFLTYFEGKTFVCQKCWCHVSEFNNFKETIILAQSRLLNQDSTSFVCEPEMPKLVPIKPEYPSTSKMCIKEEPILSFVKIEDTQLMQEILILPDDTSETIVKQEPSEEFISTDASSDDSDSSSFYDEESSELLEPEAESYFANIKTIKEKNDDIIAKWRPSLECPFCNKSYTNLFAVREHCKEEHENSKFYVKCCNRTLYSRALILEHARFHIDPDSCKCEICGSFISSRYGLRRHQRVVHEILLPTPQSRDPTMTKYKRTSQKDFDEIIAQWQKELECGVCKQPNCNYRTLYLHFRSEHPNEKAHIVCCGLKLESRLQLRDHALLHQQPDALKCELCSKYHTTSKSLYNHMRSLHPDAFQQGERKYKCKDCSRRFNGLRKLREHMTTHRRQDLYKCLFCAETFQYSSRMYRHLNKEHPKEWADRKNIRNFTSQMRIDF